MSAQRFLEIRIHGVNGTPPDAMLGLPGPEAVEREISYTDTTTSFFVARPQYDDPGQHPVEAYSWGSLTAGSGGLLGPLIRVAWLTLLPFALVNVAYWSRPRLDQIDAAAPAGTRAAGWSRWVSAGAVKWAGLLFTLLMTVAACAVAVDFLAVGCFQGAGFTCDAWATAPLRWIGQAPADMGRRVALASVVPAAMLVALFALSINTKRRYEAVPDEESGSYTATFVDPSHPSAAVTDHDLVLRRRKMWAGQDRVGRLQLVHLAGGFSAVALYGSLIFWPATAAVITAALAGVALLGAVIALALGVRDGNDFYGPNPRDVQASRVTRASLLLAVLALVVFCVAGFSGLLTRPTELDLEGVSAPGTLVPGALYTALWSIIGFCSFSSRSRVMSAVAAAVPWVLVVLGRAGVLTATWASVAVAAAVVGVVVAAGLWWHRRHLVPGHAWGGAAPGLVLGAALIVGTLFTLTGVFSLGWIISAGPSPFLNIGDLKDTYAAFTANPDAPQLPPTPLLLDWLAIGILPWLLALIGIGLAVTARFRRAARPALSEQATRDEWGNTVVGLQPPFFDAAALGALCRRRLGRRTLAAQTHRVERLIGLAAVVTIVCGYSVVLAVAAGSPDWRSTDVAGLLSFLAASGVLAAFVVSLGLVVLAARVRGSASVRRSVAVLWDITTFLPRTAHPFAPPCYAERVVPEVTRRVRDALREGYAVVLSGHSQGSTIAVAVASRLSDDELVRVRLVTYGSQLRAWFGRIFPGVLGTWALGNEPLNQQWDFSTAAPDAPAVEPVGYYPEGPGRAPMSLLARMLTATASTTPVPWLNLYRRTDPIGFRVFADGEAAADVFLSEADTTVQRSDPTSIPTHSDYPRSETYAAVVGPWLEEPRSLQSGGAGGPALPPPLPPPLGTPVAGPLPPGPAPSGPGQPAPSGPGQPAPSGPFPPTTQAR